MVSSSLPTVSAGSGRVYFYRSDSVVGMAVQPEIRLDNRVVGRSQPGGFFFVDTTPGRHVATSQTEVEERLEFDVAAGQTVYVTSSIGFGLLVGRVHLNLRPEGMALSELVGLRYTGNEPVPVQSAAAPAASPPPATSPPATASPTRGRVTLADLDALLPAPKAGAAR